MCYVFRNVDERMKGGEHRSHVLDEMRSVVVLSNWMSAILIGGTCHMLTDLTTN